MIKKFGLDEARKLVGEPDAHLPTVKATLKILGVPNIVGRQVAKLVAGAQKAIQTATADKNRIGVADAEDEKATTKTILDLRTGRKGRAEENAGKIAGFDTAVAGNQQAITDLQELAKKFA